MFHLVLHNSKDSFLVSVFSAFVKANRATNGRNSGTFRFWLDCKFINLKYHIERKNDKPEDSFFEAFKSYLLYLQSKSKYCTSIIIMSDNLKKCSWVIHLGDLKAECYTITEYFFYVKSNIIRYIFAVFKELK